MSANFLGRERELKELELLYCKAGFSFVVVYGRRRVGKSSLIQQFIANGGKSHISFMALEQTDSANLQSFSEVVLEKYPQAKSYLSSFESWEKVFDYLIEQSKGEKLVLFVDEYPYIANANGAISSIMQKYIDLKFKATNIMLVLCGSSVSFMEHQVLGHKSPLYGRRDMQLKVEPFDYLDSARFFGGWSNVDKALAYAVTGGIAQYLEKISKYDCVDGAIKAEFLKKSGSLYEEPRNLLLQELREPAVYNTIIKAIASGATKINEIAQKSNEESKKVSKYIDVLLGLHMVKKEIPAINAKERSGLYRLSDNMFKFWYTFVTANNTNIELDMCDYVYDQKILPVLPHYMGFVFEDICIQYLKRKNASLSLPIVFDNIGRWWGNNPKEKRQEEIDVIAYNDTTAIFGECKWQDSVDIGVLDALIAKGNLFNQFANKHYYIFAKGKFSKSLQEKATQTDNIHLISLREIFA